MSFERFSEKQLRVLTWWHNPSLKEKQAIICDGAVRSGKTSCMAVSFILWSMARFQGQSFALCGKTITSLKRNVITPLIPILKKEGFGVKLRHSENLLTVEVGKRENRYYLFGGKDEGSAALIQGITLAGVFFDEVVLMPRSFVEQALARCSVEGSLFWFNCNPSHPHHWFYVEWILCAEKKNTYYLHFTMEDNPGLSRSIKKRYNALYTGFFYERYVLGKWTAVHGAVYPMFSEELHVVSSVPQCSRFVISCDYGTVNPASFGLWGQAAQTGVWYRLREYYYDSRKEGVQRTDEEYLNALEALAQGLEIEAVVVDPSASSFITALRQRKKYKIVPANNDVLQGIQTVAKALADGLIKIQEGCCDILREFSLYRWDLNAPADRPVKEDDHAMDELRYFAAYAFAEKTGNGFAAMAINRGA